MGGRREGPERALRPLPHPRQVPRRRSGDLSGGQQQHDDVACDLADGITVTVRGTVALEGSTGTRYGSAVRQLLTA